MGDLKPILERIVALRQSIVDDGIRCGVPFHVKDLHTLAERLASEGTSFNQVTLPRLGKALDYGLSSGQFSCPMGFTMWKGSKLPSFLGRVFCTIFDEEGKLLRAPNITSVYFLRQFLLLDSKLILEPSRDQKNAVIDGFKARQQKLKRLRLDKSHPVLLRAQRLLGRVLKDLDLSDIIPGHGPGIVAEGFDRLERWDFRSWPSRAERWYPFHVYGSQSFMALCALGAPMMVSNSITRCALVPKDYKGPRLISAESAATQYLQQGQMKLMMEYTQRHWLLRQSIRFRDQTHNQKMAYRAFEHGLVTLDLSNASDLVSAPLVWFLLAKVPRLRSQLFCTRSQFMRINGELVKLYSFSPMGSAVCFPVESLVFWALSYASTRFVQFHASQSCNGPEMPSESETASAVAVFGDDIIVPDYAVATLIGTLESVGCEVNTSKTCLDTPFRESCGSEWFGSTDVTIIRNRRYYYDASKEVINTHAILDLQRKFFLHGLYNASALLRRWAQEIGPILTLEPRYLVSTSLLQSHPGEILKGVGRVPSRTGYSVLPDRHQSKCTPEIHTGFPSGMEIFVRSAEPFDSVCCAFGWSSSLDRGVPTRYNKAYQRVECRLPRVYQRTVQWDLHSSIVGRRSGFHRVPREFSSGVFPKERFHYNYPRLLARVSGDSVERIAIRGIMLKMAWSELPSSWTLI